jgi:hypothetical protein
MAATGDSLQHKTWKMEMGKKVPVHNENATGKANSGPYAISKTTHHRIHLGFFSLKM